MHFRGGGIHFDDVVYYLFEKRHKSILTKCNLHLQVQESAILQLSCLCQLVLSSNNQ